MFLLRAVYESQVLIYKLDQPSILIGRDSQAKISIDHPAVSRRHALIELIDDTLFISDQKSENGTLVNEKPLEKNARLLLQPGDEILVGDRLFTLLSEHPTVTDSTTALSEYAHHPQGPSKAFPPDPIPSRPATDTVAVAPELLKLEADIKEESEGRGPSLCLPAGARHGLPVLITQPEFLIGRGSKTHLRLTDEGASKIHCRLVRRKGRYYLYDENSLNGTYVNGIRTRGAALCDGDSILVGSTVILFSDPESPKTQADPAQVEKEMAALLHREGSAAAAIRFPWKIAAAAMGTTALLGVLLLSLRLAGVV